MTIQVELNPPIPRPGDRVVLIVKADPKAVTLLIKARQGRKTLCDRRFFGASLCKIPFKLAAASTQPVKGEVRGHTEDAVPFRFGVAKAMAEPKVKEAGGGRSR